MKIRNNHHTRLSLKITLFGVSFLTVFFSLFLLFSFYYLLDTESNELRSISQINLGVSATGIVVSSGTLTENILSTSTGIIFSGGILSANTSVTEIVEPSTLIEKTQKSEDLESPAGVVGVVRVSSNPEIFMEGGYDVNHSLLQGQRIFELTRDSLVETKEGSLIKNGIFNYDSFDIPYLLKQKKDIFTEKIAGEYYLFYKIDSEGDTYVFAQNVNSIFLFIYKSLLICFVSILLFSVCLFFLSRYLIQLFMKPIEENNARLKEYNHNLAHEIKTPLTVMTLNLGVLEDDENKELIESTREEIFKIKNITDTLLFLSENFVVKKKETVLMSALIEKFIQKHLSKEAIEFVLKDTDINVSIDVNMFERLLKNLVENALKYSSDQKVCITLEKDAIIFSNNVINDIDTSKLFDIFFQGDNSRASEGYGLGLALVKRIVEILGWQIQISCEKKIFTVEIYIK